MTDIIKCNKCGQVLISGRGAIVIFGPGTSIGCRKCGNEYVFGRTDTDTHTIPLIDRPTEKET